MVAWSAGQPVFGSVMAVSDMPTPTPLPFTSNTALLLLPGSAPRSRRCAFRHANACTRYGSAKPTMNGLKFG
jgi:hypothetical protein